jgi:hypothetical protein
MADEKSDKDETRIKWQAVDEETGNASSRQQAPRPQLTRTLSSSSSFSIRSAGGRTTVDPGVTLPIHYRSV